MGTVFNACRRCKVEGIDGWCVAKSVWEPSLFTQDGRQMVMNGRWDTLSVGFSVQAIA